MFRNPPLIGREPGQIGDRVRCPKSIARINLRNMRTSCQISYGDDGEVPLPCWRRPPRSFTQSITRKNLNIKCTTCQRSLAFDQLRNAARELDEHQCIVCPLHVHVFWCVGPRVGHDHLHKPRKSAAAKRQSLAAAGKSEWCAAAAVTTLLAGCWLRKHVRSEPAASSQQLEALKPHLAFRPCAGRSRRS